MLASAYLLINMQVLNLSPYNKYDTKFINLQVIVPVLCGYFANNYNVMIVEVLDGSFEEIFILVLFFKFSNIIVRFQSIFPFLNMYGFTLY